MTIDKRRLSRWRHRHPRSFRHNRSEHTSSLGSRARALCLPRSLIRPHTMHNKRALDRRLCRESAAARLLSQQWRGRHSVAVLETPGKQGNNAPHEPHFDGISRIWGCAHANKLSLPPPPRLSPSPFVVLSRFSRALHLLCAFVQYCLSSFGIKVKKIVKF